MEEPVHVALDEFNGADACKVRTAALCTHTTIDGTV